MYPTQDEMFRVAPFTEEFVYWRNLKLMGLDLRAGTEYPERYWDFRIGSDSGPGNNWCTM